MIWPQYLTDDMKAQLAKAKKDREEHLRTCADLVERLGLADIREFPASVMRETGARRVRPRSARFEPVRLEEA